jgi:hypothetical protein
VPFGQCLSICGLILSWIRVTVKSLPVDCIITLAQVRYLCGVLGAGNVLSSLLDFRFWRIMEKPRVRLSAAKDKKAGYGSPAR